MDTEPLEPIDTSPSAAPSSDAHRCDCGAQLPSRRAAGQRRLYCSAACRRRHDRLTRQLRRRLDLIHRLEVAKEQGRRDYSREQIDAVIADERLKVDAITQAMTGTRTNAGISTGSTGSSPGG